MRHKYYVTCGTLRVVLLAENELFAAMDAVQNHAKDELLEEIVCIDQRGFRTAYADVFLRLDLVMNQINEELNAED